MERVKLVGLIRMDTPAGVVRVCDGGWLDFAGERYRSSDPVWGTLDGFESLTEGVGDEAPAGTLTFLPSGDATPQQINNGDNQGSSLRMWVVELDADTGTQIGDGDLMTDSMVDRTLLRLSENRREVDVDFVPRSERFFLLDEGNTLSPSFHKSVWPGELGCDNATGVATTVAWGTAAQRGVTGGSYGGGNGGGGGGNYVDQV